MIKFKCSQPNLDVLVRLRHNGKPVNRYVRFNGKGEASFPDESGFHGMMIAKLRAEIGGNAIKGLREVRGVKK